MHPSTPSAAPRGRTLTDLDAAGYGHLFGPALRPDRPDFLLHLVRAPHDRHGGPSPDTAATLLAGRGTIDVPWMTASAWIDPVEWSEWSLPQGVGPGDYPIIGKPRILLWRPQAVSLAFPGDRPDLVPRFCLSDVVANARAAVVHVPDGLDRPDPVGQRLRLAWLASACDALDALEWRGRVVLVSASGETLGSRPELEALARPILPWRRFHYGYAANFAALALPVLGKALSDDDPEAVRTHIELYAPTRPLRRNIRESARRVAEMGICNDLMLDPLVLQALYAIRRAGAIAMPPGRTFRDGDWDKALATGGTGDGAWHGKGRHAPRRITAREARCLAMALLNNLLIVTDADAVRLSRIGEAFLDGLHPACEDADLPLRWHGGWADRRPDDAKAMDAWLARTFTKVMRR